MTGTMSHLFRYIFSQVLRTSLVVTVILLAVVWLSQSLRFIELIVNQGLGIGGFLTISSLLLPSFLGLILPISTFIAVAIVYIKLHNDRELIVMRAGGLGPLRIMTPALGVAVLMSGLLYSINLYFLPSGYTQFKAMQYELRNDLAGLIVREGSFNTMSDDLTVYVRNREASGTLSGLLLHDARDPKQPVTMMAERGTLVRTADGPRFVLESGNRQQYDRATGQLNTLYFDRYVLDMNHFTDDTPADRWRNSEERYIGELLSPDLSDPNDRANVHKFWVEAHQRLAWPLYPLAFVLLAGAAVLGGTFNRRGTWMRTLPISIIFIGTLILGISMPTIIVHNTSLAPLLYGLPAAIATFALWALYQTPKKQKGTRSPSV